MGLLISGSNGNGQEKPPIDWALAKKEVLARLDIRKEYELLGVKLAGVHANEKGFVPCYAVGRDASDPDTRPSAAINVRSGNYLDKGLSDKGTGFFGFAVDHGPHGSFIEAFRHYADKVGYELGRVERHERGIIEKAYDYAEWDGAKSYRVLRLVQANGKKTFAQRSWDGERWVGGRGCMEGVEPLPYRLMELLDAPIAEPVLWPEGEADVDRAREAGFVATTNHEGAHNWESTGARFLHRLPPRDYVVIPDNDDVGRRHALKVAAALHGHVKAVDPSWVVKVLPMPGVPVGGDLGDWMDTGGTAEELRAMIAAAPEWVPGVEIEVETPAEEPATPPELERNCNVADLRKVMSAVSWTWPFWMANAALTLLAAEAGTGKTRLMMDLHRRAYHGLPWPDGAPMLLPPGGKVLWVPADSQHQEICDIPAEFGIPDEAVELSTPVSDPFGGTELKTADDLKNLEARIKLARPYWVVIDTVTNTSDLKSHDTADAKKQYKPLQEIALRLQVPIVCVTHTNAAGGTLGRRANEKVRVVMAMLQPDPDQEHRRKLWVPKSRAVKPPPLGVTMGTEGNEYDANPPEPPADDAPKGGRKAPKRDACAAWLKDCLAGGIQAVCDLIDQAEDAGYSKGTLYLAKAKLDIDEFRMGSTLHWRLNVPEGDEEAA